MPFTPFHMGPGIAVKALLQGSFSLMVFGWSQIVMDFQPLVAMVTGEGKLHGFSHTYAGATLIAIFSAVTGKYFSEWGLAFSLKDASCRINVRWRIAFLSAFIGSYSHVVLDSIMHHDMEPFSPFWGSNQLLGVIPVSTLHKFCFYSGLVGSGTYFVVNYFLFRYNNSVKRG